MSKLTQQELRNGLEKYGEKYGNSKVFQSFLWQMIYPGKLATQDEADEFDRLLFDIHTSDPNRLKISYEVCHTACGNDVYQSWDVEDATQMIDEFVDQECSRCCHEMSRDRLTIENVFHWRIET